MASISIQILDAIEAALQVATAGGTTKPAGLAVHRNRALAIENDDLPAIVVYPLDEDPNPEEDHINQVLRELGIGIECRVLVPEGEYADAVLDPLYVWTVKALKVDETFGELAMQIKEGPRSWDDEIHDVHVAALTQEWTAQFFRNENDPETA